MLRLARTSAQAKARGSVATIWHSACSGMALAASLVCLASQPTPTRAAPDAPQNENDRHRPSELAALLDTYFRCEDTDKRRSLTASIERAAGASVAILAQTAPALQLWDDLPHPTGHFRVDTGITGTIDVAYRLPRRYDPMRHHALVLCMAPAETQHVRATLGRAADDAILIAPASPIGGAFLDRGASGMALPRLMREIRRRFRVDTDRILLFGSGAGGDAAWLAAIMHADLFSSAIFLSSYPHLPLPRQTYSFLPDNLRGLRVWSFWRTPDGRRAESGMTSIALHNRVISDRAARTWPQGRFTGIERAADSAEPLVPADWDWPSATANPSPPRRVAKWFRYLGQGSAAWLKATAFRGDVWEAEQLAVRAAPTTDRDQFIRRVIQGRLGFLSGRVEGQTITVLTRRCADIELLLPEDLVDLDRPVTVTCNGRVRHRGLIRRRVATWLEAAYRTWDFQRVPVARLSFSVKTDAPLD